MLTIAVLSLLGLVILLALLRLAPPLLGQGVPYVPSSEHRVTTALKLAELKPGMTVVDLGSGDGRLLIAAARQGARAIGYEINPWLVLTSRWAARRAGMDDRVTVRLASLWQADVREIDVVFIYILPRLLPRLATKLRRELKPGARVVTLGWPLPGWHTRAQIDRVYQYDVK